MRLNARCIGGKREYLKIIMNETNLPLHFRTLCLEVQGKFLFWLDENGKRLIVNKQ